MNDREKLIKLIQSAVDGCAEYWAGLIADSLIANGVTVQQWISVAERLPEQKENPVLAVFYGMVNPAWYFSGKWELPSGFITDNVTHWTHMPKPPKGENNA